MIFQERSRRAYCYRRAGRYSEKEQEESKGLGQQAGGARKFLGIFFRGLAQQSGGEYKQLAPNAGGVVLLKTPGDVDDNGCVDYADYNMVLQVYGMQVTNNHPITYHADFDGNGWIDGDDYLAVLQNWGSGCVNAP